MTKLLKDYPPHRIVKIDGRWGVVCLTTGVGYRRLFERVVDFWDGGPEHVDNNSEVEDEA